jgi:succinate dehydrogenase / fumarate reductase cytochrome b subunit
MPVVHNDGTSQSGGITMAAIRHLYRAVTYRGREGQIAWLLHRITGIGVFLFLLLHIVDIFLMSFGPGVFDAVLFIYHQFLFKLLIVFGLYLGVLYHALNGIRVVLIDFFPPLARYQAQLWRVQLVIFALAYIPSAILMLSAMFDGH